VAPPSTDLTALTWCLGEIRESLARATEALTRGLHAGEPEPARLRAARSALHQAHGALQLVDLDGVAVFTQEAEGLLDRCERGERPLDAEVVSVLTRAFAALVEFLEGVVAGSGDSPVSLFPQYRDLLALREAERAEPADLYPVDLSVRPPKATRTAPLDAEGVARVRAAFERGLLGFLRDPEDPTALAQLYASIERLLRAHQASGERTFWWLAAAFFDALRVRALPIDLYAKRLVARVNLQIRRTLQQGSPIADRMLRDLLFMLARAREGSALADEARTLYRLSGTVPDDFETPRYGLVDARALAAAREAAAAAKLAWEKAVRGGPQQLPAFATAAQGIDVAFARLPWPGLRRLAKVLLGLRRMLDAGDPPLAQVLSLEVATSLLFVERALEGGALEVGRHDGRAAELAERIAGLCERGRPDGAPMPAWLAEWSRAAQQGVTVAAFVAEAQSNLRACEQALDVFFRDPARRGSLPGLARLLGQVGGALRLLGHAEAAAGVDAVLGQVAAFAAAEDPPAPADCERVAASLAALGFFLASLPQTDRSGVFRFSRDEGAFVARLGDPPLVRQGSPAPASAGAAPFDGVASPAAPVDPAVSDEAATGACVPAPDDAGGSLEALLSMRRARLPELLAALRESPGDPVRRAALRDTLVAVRDEAMLLDDADLRRRADDALAHLDGDVVAQHAALADALARVAGERGAPRPAVASVPPDAAAVDDELLGVFLDEAEQVLEAIAAGCEASMARRADVAVLTTIRRGFHTLKGSSRMVGLASFGEAAWGMEQVLNGMLAEERPGTLALYQGIADARETMAAWVARLRVDPAARIDPSRLVAGAIALRAGQPWPVQAEPESSDALEAEVPVPSPLDEADGLLAALDATVARWRADPSAPVDEPSLRAVHSLAGSTRVVGLDEVHAAADALERFMLGCSVSGAPVRPQDVEDVAFVLERARASLHRFAAGREPGEDPAMTERAEALAERWAESIDAGAYEDGSSATVPAAASPRAEFAEGVAPLDDDIDAELVPVFIEEADDLLPRIGDALRAWQHSLDDAAAPGALMRLLHTVKGSARMAGAMRLGQLVHDMETRIEAASALSHVPGALVDDLIARHDQVLASFEAIRDPRAEAAQAMAGRTLPADGAAAPSVAPATPETSRQLIRVRADLLDRLVNEAGEVSIARARLENELGGIRQSLGELSENVNRLRSQLREIELAADTRIQASDARHRESDAEFDPLEFDRYTRFQELTRMLAESVSDVATVQQNALRNLDEAHRDLARQSQVTRDLQHDLMRIRMVRFGSIADRLYRVVRQAAKDLDKRVHLDLRGAGVELDRGVLERMAGPIEHLLRNSVAHGIEPRAERVAAGKSETGEITLEVRQEGNEVILTFADDGAGLDFGRIRERALERGLIAPDAHPGRRELGNLIFMPGFTTAATVTAIAGRGVGMDVVRAEVAALGGRIDLESVPGRGTRFAVHLPVSLAVAQVVLLSVGAVRIAVASALVEQVLQLKPEGLATAYADHHVPWQGHPVPLYFLGSLLELPGCTPLAQRYSPVVVVRSGSVRIALHVDHVAPSQEVVVKHVGPQLARLTGMAGATVLGNGDIVLILNPVQITATGRGAQAGEGDTASFAPTRIEIAPTVMVVDDSVTVRKVTQRLLAREGYQVMLAKDGLDALRQLQDTVPEVMLLDIEMPRMDGFDLTRTLRADERLKHVPIVMITSRTADKHRNHAMALGVDVFLGKPYDEAELLGHVKALAARRLTAG
jgi:chemosensory pili system protein ChpA (sensor histidine kinase/response regulator)